MTNTARTLRNTLRGINALALACTLAYFVPQWDTASDQHRADPQTTAQAQAATLLAEHDCWTSNGPAGVIPGHAVYTLPGRGTAYGPASVGFAIWQDDKPGILHGFCR